MRLSTVSNQTVYKLRDTSFTEIRVGQSFMANKLLPSANFEPSLACF